jgi:hypothetical protein
MFSKIIKMSFAPDDTFFVGFLFCRRRKVWQQTGSDSKCEYVYDIGNYSCQRRDCLPFLVVTEHIRGVHTETLLRDIKFGNYNLNLQKYFYVKKEFRSINTYHLLNGIDMNGVKHVLTLQFTEVKLKHIIITLLLKIIVPVPTK